MDLGIVTLGVVILIGYILWQHDASLKERKSSLQNSFNDIDDFVSTQRFIVDDGLKGIAFDESSKKFVICSHAKNEVVVSSIDYFVTTNVFSYQDILSVEIFYDGDMVTKTNRASQIGGALVGGLALGGLGAIVGGLSGKTKSKKEIEKIELRIIVNDKQSPIQDIIFFNTKCKNNTPLYLESEKSARHWFAIVSLLIEEADKEDEQKALQSKRTKKVNRAVSHQNDKVSVDPKNDNGTIVDILSQLNELFEKGILTEDEFSKAKKKALGVV